MNRIILSATLAVSVAACGGTPPFGLLEPNADTNVNNAYLTEDNAFLTLNNVSYDANSDTLQINNIPFDDPVNNYEKITTENFANGFDAYTSAPAPGSNEIEYFAVFRRSNSGQSQVSGVGTDGYVDFGYGGGAAQRLGNRPNLPRQGIYSYNGEYAAVRTNRTQGQSGTQLVTGVAEFSADFGDFDDVGAVGGVIFNRQIYDTTGAPIQALDGFISLTDASIDFANSSIMGATANEIVNGNTTASGTWRGIFAGPGGREIAGVLFVEGSNIREVGGLIVDCVGAACP